MIKVRGHERSPSDTRAFQERTKRDAEIEMQRELDRLKSTAPSVDQVSQDFEGFTKLFKRFLQETGPSLEWDRIQKLPEDSVIAQAATRT